MTTSINHPDEVTLDLLTELIKRLDHMLVELGQATELFGQDLRADPWQHTRPAHCQEQSEEDQVDTHNAITEELARARAGRSKQQLLLDLQCLSVKLSALIAELELSLGVYAPIDRSDDGNEQDADWASSRADRR